jgi:hypothetical protein
MAQLTPQSIVQSGTIPTFAAATVGGDNLTNNGNVVLHYKNGGGAGITITVHASGPCDMNTTHDYVFTIAAGAEAIIGKFDLARFGQSPSITYSSVTSLTVAAYESLQAA